MPSCATCRSSWCTSWRPLRLPLTGGQTSRHLPTMSRWQDDRARQIIEQAHKVAVEAASPSRAPHVTSEVLHAPIVPTLVDLSKEAELVVVGCRGEGAVARALLGSVSSGLVHHAHCPVAVVHDEDPLTARSPQAPVVVGIDGSPTSELATEIAFDEASRRGVGLVALHAWRDMGPLDFPSTNWAPIEWRNIKEPGGRSPGRASLRMARPVSRRCGAQDRGQRPASTRLLEQAQTAQLVVVGSHGRGGFPACCSARSAARSCTPRRFR